MINVTKSTADTYYLCGPEFEWAKVIVCPEGDLLIQGDYGYFAYSWRSFGPDFKAFLSDITPEYVFQKFDNNATYLFKKGLPKHVKVPVIAILLKLKSVLVDEMAIENAVK